MPVVFSSAPGQVVRIVSKRPAQRMLLRMVEPVFNFLNSACIVTGASIRQQANFQELHTLEDFAEISSFGDKVADLQLDGSAFLQLCDETAPGAGVGAALDFYATNRLTVRSQPLFLLIGARPFKGFLVDSRIELLNPEFGLAQFAFGLRALPE